MVIGVDRYVLETLMPDLVGHDRKPSAFIVYLALWVKSDGKRGRRAAASLRELSEGAGLSKRAVQGALAKLGRRRLISVERSSLTAVPVYTLLRPWRRAAS